MKNMLKEAMQSRSSFLNFPVLYISGMQFSLVAVQVIYVHWGYLLYRRFAPYSRYHHVSSYQHTNIQPYSHITQHLAAFQIVESFNFFCCTYRQVLNLPTKKITEDVREKKCDSIKELSLAEDGHVTSCQQLSLSSCYELKRSQNWKWTYSEKKTGFGDAAW